MDQIIQRIARSHRRQALWSAAGVVAAALLASLLLLFTDRDEEFPGYSLAAVRGGETAVPRAFTDNLPEPGPEMRVSAEYKDRFIKTVLPLVLHANEAIERDRKRLITIVDHARSGRPLSRRDQRTLSRIATRYRTPMGDTETLMRRVDLVPPSLALAQAAAESGWGTSRFALEGNALFGLRTWNESKGLVPKARAEDAGHAVTSYNALADSVRVYMWTLNTHPAYLDFRKQRAALRNAARPLDALKLVPWLKSYSERGAHYVRLIGRIIRRERLWEFDRTRLAQD